MKIYNKKTFIRSIPDSFRCADFNYKYIRKRRECKYRYFS